MKKEKRYLKSFSAFVLALLLALTLAACSDKKEEQPAKKDQSEKVTQSEEKTPPTPRDNPEPDEENTLAESYLEFDKASFYMVNSINILMVSEGDDFLFEESINMSVQAGKRAIALFPLKALGKDKALVKEGFKSLGENIEYTGDGNTCTLSWRNGGANVCEGRYDAEHDRLRVTRTTDGQRIFSFEYRATEYGYAALCYFPSWESGTSALFEITVSGSDGYYGVSIGAAEPPELNGLEGFDFPSSADRCYSIIGGIATIRFEDGNTVELGNS